jgi:hypothetical protein
MRRLTDSELIRCSNIDPSIDRISIGIFLSVWLLGVPHRPACLYVSVCLSVRKSSSSTRNSIGKLAEFGVCRVCHVGFPGVSPSQTREQCTLFWTRSSASTLGPRRLKRKEREKRKYEKFWRETRTSFSITFRFYTSLYVFNPPLMYGRFEHYTEL